MAAMGGSPQLGIGIAAALAAALVFAACTEPAADPPPPEDPPFDYPLDDELRIHHMQVKGTHNSYHVDTLDGAVADWAYTHAPLGVQAACQGVRQFELDVARQDDGTFAVYHVPMVDEGTNCPTFRDCLGDLREWSDANPAHHPVFAMVEPKITLPGGTPSLCNPVTAPLDCTSLAVEDPQFMEIDGC